MLMPRDGGGESFAGSQAEDVDEVAENVLD